MHGGSVRHMAALLLLGAACLPLWAFERAMPGYEFEFPRDHFAHPEFQIEWWYYTGNLETPDGRRFGYVHQLAFYRSILWQVTGDLAPVHLIAVEKKQPFRCGVWRVGQDVLAIAQQDNEEAMKRLTECQRNDHWPTGYENTRTFDHL